MNKKILCTAMLSLCLATVTVAATNDVEAQKLYKTYQQSLSANDLQSAAEALEKRRNLDPDNLQWSYDEGAFLLENTNDFDKVLAVLNHGLDTAKEIKDTYWIPKFLELIAGTLFQTGDEKCLETANEAYSLYEGRKPDETLSDICQLISGIYLGRGDFTQALHFGQQALEIRRNVLGENTSKTAMTLHSLALAYLKSGDLENSRKYLTDSAAICKKIGVEAPALLNTQGLLALNQEEYSKAQDFFDRALDLCSKSHREPSLLVNVLSNLGVTQEHLGNSDKASEYMHQALNTANSYYGADSPRAVNQLKELGLMYREHGQYKEAMQTLEDALKFYDSHYGQDSAQSHDCLVEMYRCACLIVANDSVEVMDLAREFMQDKYFLISVSDKQPVYLLALGEWKMNSAASIFDYIPEMTEKDPVFTVSEDGQTAKQLAAAENDNFTIWIARGRQEHDALLALIK